MCGARAVDQRPGALGVAGARHVGIVKKRLMAAAGAVPRSMVVFAHGVDIAHLCRGIAPPLSTRADR